jgi:hypothetical protein
MGGGGRWAYIHDDSEFFDMRVWKGSVGSQLDTGELGGVQGV